MKATITIPLQKLYFIKEFFESHLDAEDGVLDLLEKDPEASKEEKDRALWEFEQMKELLPLLVESIHNIEKEQESRYPDLFKNKNKI